MADSSIFSDADPDDPRDWYVAPVAAVTAPAFSGEKSATVIGGGVFLGTALPVSLIPPSIPFERSESDDDHC